MSDINTKGVIVGTLAGAGLAFYYRRSLTRLIQRTVISLQNYWTSEIIEDEAIANLEADASARRKLTKVACCELPKLVAEDLEELGVDIELEDGGDEFGMWKAAYKWSRRARMEFDYPKSNPANKRIVSEWLRRVMKGEHVRPSQMIKLHPMAVVLTFVRSNTEMMMEQAELVCKKSGWLETGMH